MGTIREFFGGMTMAKRLTDFKVLTFDCYGTLIDWESGIWDALQPILMLNQRSDILRDDALVSFARHESSVEAETPDLHYRKVLETVHRALAGEFGLQNTDDLAQVFGQSVAHWPAFPDSADALRYLKTRYKLVILSNIDRDSFAASNRKLGVEFDAIYTAQDIGSYKPEPVNFEYLLAHLHSDLDLAPCDVLHTAQSLFHDHAPARAFGLANAWIDRQRLSEQGSWGATASLENRPLLDFSFFSMAEMAEAVSAEDGSTRIPRD
jgi:2-haloacid dehalogenase